MALINCPECQKEISDTVIVCPHCGYKIRKKTSVLKLLDDTTNFAVGVMLNIVLGIIGAFMLNKGKTEMLFWVEMKRELGYEDAMYCIKNIQKYTLMKNAGLVFIVIGIVLIIAMITYKILGSKDGKKMIEDEK